MSESERLGRRELLRRAIGMTVGWGALGVGCRDDAAHEGAPPTSAPANARAPAEPAPALPPAIRGERVLGRTGLRVSDIGMGTGGATDPDLLRYAFDRGVTYFDTAESYPLDAPGEAERAIGEAFRGRFDRIVLCSKTEASARSRRGGLMKRLHASLQRLGTDHIDVYLNHGVNDLERLRNPEWFEFVEIAKRQGKIRFAGMSGHAGRLASCLEAAIDGDLVDVVLTAYNFGEDPAFYAGLTESFDVVALQPELPRLLAKAKRKGIGVMAMKTLRGARLNDMRPFERPDGTFGQAALRWVLSSPDVDSLVVSMRDRAQVDEYLGASGATALREGDRALLALYASTTSSRYCRPACDACVSSCPNDVPIPGVLRSRMYAEDYGDPARGRGAYALLDGNADACLGCSGEPCRGACPHGLDVAALTRSTPRLLEPA